MKRLAKAMSAFTPGRSEPAAGRDAFAFATRGASSGFDGSGASSRTRVLAALSSLVLAAFALLALNASPANAAPKVFSFNFGTDGVEGGQLKQARGVAVNEDGEGGVPAGTVYVVEFGNNRISSFAPDGGTYSFLRAWGWDVIVNTGSPPNSNGTGFEICDTTTLPGANTPQECKGGTAGPGAGQFSGIAGGIAVHQDSGVVSIFDRNNMRVQQFSATGEFLRAFGKDVINGGGNGFEICENAAECKVGLTGSEAGAFASNTAALTGITVDGAGNVYASDPANARVQKFGPTGAFLAMGGWNVVASGANNGAEIQKVRVDAAGGTFTLSFGTTAPTTTSTIGYDASAAEVQSALVGLGDIGAGDILVSGPVGGPWTVRFRGALGNANQPGLGSDATNLSGDNPALPGAGPTLAVTEIVVGGGSTYEVCEATVDTCQIGTTGAGLGQFNGPPTTAGNQTPNFIAANPAGSVYVVGKGNGTIYHLHPSLDFVEEYAATTGTGVTPNRNVVAVDSTDGNLFYGRAAAPNTSIFELNPLSGALVETHNAEHDWVGMAVEGTTGRLFGTRTAAPMAPSSMVHVFEEGLPSLTIQPPDSNSGTKATLKGTVNPNGVQVADCYFEWGTTTAYGNEVECAQTLVDIGDGFSAVEVDADISGLVPNGTTYHYRLVAVGTKESRSSNQSFTTPTLVVTSPANGITAESATVHGSVNPDGAPITDCVFEYGTTTSYGQAAPCDPAAGGLTGTTTIPVEADLMNLHPGTIYNFRLKATYGGGTGPVHGANLTFQTFGPRIVAAWSENVVTTEARLKAEINPEGKATTYRFEYGTTDSYGEQTPEMPVGSNSSPHTVNRFLSGLEPGTTYHYRVVATDSDEVVNEGPDLSFTTYSPQSVDTGCANQAFRSGASAYLPDCRAYEMVSPIDKNGGDIDTAEQEAGEGSHYSSSYRQASVLGGKITFSSATAFGDVIGGHWSNQYLATRDDEQGWSTQALSGPRGRTVLEPVPLFGAALRWFTFGYFQSFTHDLSSAWIRDDNMNTLTEDAIQDYVNLYRLNTGAASYEALTNQPPVIPALKTLSQDNNANNGGPRMVGASSDGRHQVFTANAALTDNAAHSNNSQIYDFVDGTLHLVSVLPGGSPALTNSFVGTASGARTLETKQHMSNNAVANDGSRIVWTTSEVHGRRGALYVRENPGEAQSALSGGVCIEVAKACTVHVAGNAPGAGGAGPESDRAQFWSAHNDASKVLYSMGAHPNWNLFLFDVATRTSEPIAEEVQGVAAAGENLEHIYFVSSEVLDGGAVEGKPNLYDYTEGTATFVATLSGEDVKIGGQNFGGSFSALPNLLGLSPNFNVTPQPVLNQTRASADGKYFVFMSNQASLAQASGAYDNVEASSGDPTFQVYRYDADSGSVTCVSCKPSGARSIAHAARAPYSPLELEFSNQPEIRIGASIPTHEHDNYASRVLSSDGQRVYFHSDDALVPRDSNGIQDVYQWQAAGSGSCQEDDPAYSERNQGCISLISSGRDKTRSEFVDATPDGDEIYFTTDEGLDPVDPGLRDIYVAKVGGGFAVNAAAASCEGEACQSPPPAPEFGTPSSSTFQGAGNSSPGTSASCTGNQVRRGNRCVAKRRLALRACARRRGKAKQRCIRNQVRRLNRAQQRQQRAANTSGRAGR